MTRFELSGIAKLYPKDTVVKLREETGELVDFVLRGYITPDGPRLVIEKIANYDKENS